MRTRKVLTSAWNYVRLFGEFEIRLSRRILASTFGPNGLERDELLIIVALALVARGLWLAWQPAAYLVPGLVILWIALPSRSAFVAPRDPVPTEKPTRRKA